MIENFDNIMNLLEKQKRMCTEVAERCNELAKSETNLTLGIIYQHLSFISHSSAANAETSGVLLDALNQLTSQLNEILSKIPKPEDIEQIKKGAEQLEVKVAKTLQPLAKKLEEAQERAKRGEEIYE